jgi:IMP dehydrogenase
VPGDPCSHRAARDTSPDFITDRHLAGIGDDAAIDLGHDGETPRQRGQGTDRVEFLLSEMQAVAAGLDAPLQGMSQADAQFGIARREHGHPLRGRGAHQRGERMAQADVLMLDLGAQGLAQSLLEFIEPLGALLQAHARIGPLQAMLQMCQPLLRRAQLAPPGLHQSLADAPQGVEQRLAIGHHQFCRTRRRGGAHIGDKVGNREVNFVADAADDRNGAGANGARHRLVVECPQIFKRTTTADQDEHIAIRARRGQLERLDQGRHCRCPLHRRGIDQHLGRRVPALENVQDIAYRGAAGRGDHSNPAREGGQSAFELGGEQAFGRQPGLETLEFALQRADSGFLHVIEDHLVVAAWLVEADAAADQHQLAGLGGKSDVQVALAEHGATDLRFLVLEREIPVSGGGLAEIRQLGFQPDHGEAPFQQQPHLPVEPGDAENIAFGGLRHNRSLPDPGECVECAMRILEEALTFDDVLLVPAHSAVLPREVDLSTTLTRTIRLGLPVLSAAMDTVTEARLAITIAQEGGMGIIHKNMPIDAQAREVARVKKFESGVIRDPITVPPGMSIREVLQLTRARGISGVPVVDGSKVVGIVTHRDLRFEEKLDAPVSSVMTPQQRLITVRENAPKEEVLGLLHKHRIEKVLVVGADSELKGMITVKDFQKATDFPRASKDDTGRLRVGAAVGTAADTLERVAELSGAGVDVVVVDTSHGHSQGVIEMVRHIKKRWPQLQLIAGNIVTAEAARDLVEAGADAVKVGIGPGSICTTRIVAGVGVPQISAVSNVSRALEGTGVPVIADGGIRFSGDLAKAIAAGAHAVMIGGMFAGTEESPGEVELYQGASYKAYRGMGSLGAMADKHGSADRYFQDAAAELEKLVPEGIEGRVAYKGSLVSILHQLAGGLRAAMGYTGSASIEIMRTRPKFVRITNAGIRESHVHDVTITKEAPNYRVS